MTRKSLEFTSLGPALVIAGGLLVASVLSALTRGMSWPLQAAGPLSLVLAFAGADLLSARLQRRPLTVSVTSLVLSLVYLASTLLVWLDNPAQLPMAIPVLGGCIAQGIMLQGQARNRNCPI